MNYDTWKLETPDEEQERLESPFRRRLMREEMADDLYERERDRADEEKERF